MPETWKRVAGYGDHYEVSSIGRVRSNWGKGRILRQSLGTNGYLGVKPSAGGGVQETREVHCLVAEAFLGPRPKGLDIRHLDGNKQNNVLENLEYATRSRNMQDMKWHGSPRYVLRPADVRYIKQRLGPRGMGRTLARKFGVTDAAISSIKRGRYHADIRVHADTSA